jgi:hypothetical protein
MWYPNLLQSPLLTFRLQEVQKLKIDLFKEKFKKNLDRNLVKMKRLSKSKLKKDEIARQDT